MVVEPNNIRGCSGHNSKTILVSARILLMSGTFTATPVKITNQMNYFCDICNLFFFFLLNIKTQQINNFVLINKLFLYHRLFISYVCLVLTAVSTYLLSFSFWQRVRKLLNNPHHTFTACFCENQWSSILPIFDIKLSSLGVCNNPKFLVQTSISKNHIWDFINLSPIYRHLTATIKT